MAHRNWGLYKSVLHFDFPHYYATNSGLKDEVSQEDWTLNGNATLASRYTPADYYHDNAPKFGYRCLLTRGQYDYVSCRNNHSTFPLNLSDGGSMSIFLLPLSGSEGGVISLMNGENISLALRLTSARTLRLESSSWGIGATGSTALSLGAWHYALVSWKGSNITLWLDGNQEISVTASGASQNVTQVRIGGCEALLDEFTFGGYSNSYAVPSQPHNAVLNITDMGGWGTGSDGAFSLTTGIMSINAYATLKACSGTDLTISSWGSRTGNLYKTLKQGDELMFHVMTKSGGNLCGLYEFRRVSAISGTRIIINRPVEAFDMAGALSAGYVISVTKIPNFTSFNLGADAVMSSSNYRMIAFRCSGNATWSGGTDFAGSFPTETDSLTLSHSDLPDRLIPAQGGVMIFCGGTFTAPSSAAIGTKTSAKILYSGGYSEGGIMIGTNAGSNYHAPSILIAASKLNIDDATLRYGATSKSMYSGLCYLAGDVA